MSPVLIIALVVVGLLVITFLVGLSPDPRRRRPPGILKRRSRWRRWLPVLPLMAAIACLALAFLGVRVSFQETSPMVVLVMDVSNSMNATDVAPSRLVAAENAARAFLEELPPDFRVGLTTFAGQAVREVAPTQERTEVLDALGTFETSFGTLIGDGLDEALDSIEDARDGGESPAAAVLLSDGRDTGSLIEPAVAADRAQSMGVPVFTVVMGQVEGAETGLADLETLREIAEISGGETFTAETADELTARYENLGSQLSVELEVPPSSTPLVVAAIGLVVVSGVLLVITPR